MYVVGGLDNVNGIILATVEAYDPATNTWTTRRSMPTPRFALSVGVVNGILYAVGGRTAFAPSTAVATVEAYDPATDTWTTSAPMPTPRSYLAAGVVNNVLHAVGGFNPTNGSLATVEAFSAEAIQVQIDVMPGTFPNVFSLTDRDITVAVLTTPSFNAATVNVSTVRFAGAVPSFSALRDKDGDGDLDLVLLFAVPALDLTCASKQATLTGQTTTGLSFQGTDSIRIMRDRTGQYCPKG